MSYRWVPTDAAHASDLGLGQPFADQAEAEAWLSSYYEDLAEAGVTEVSLYEEDRLVYGPMSLLPD
ncbi:MAG: hypothetical protein Q3997_01160 [Propionibacteriaceae bacterium]|nr:hypothetical protein [Propionibacteriaceae bacterium]